MKLLTTVFAVALFFYSPGAARAQAGMGARPHVIIYKTKGDYRDYVPVTLSEDKKTVVSYPDPSDVKTGSAYAMPVVLHKGYLLDKRGVGVNTAFLKMTYKEYAALSAPPPPAQLYNMIMDKDPIKELYDCGVRSPQKNSEQQLNLAIDHKQLKKKYKEVR